MLRSRSAAVAGVSAVTLCVIPAILAAPTLNDAATAPVATPAAIPVLPDDPFNYADVELPDHYLLNRFIGGGGPGQRPAIDTDNTPANNPTTDLGATLGRVLFYDTSLSANASTSCASCHVQEFGFSDPNTLSFGFEGGTTRRHSMGLANARFSVSGTFFWDERAMTLEDQVLMPFQDSVEMGLTLDQLVQLVASQPYYPELFTDAFGDADVTPNRIARALAQFVRSIVSITSKYDEGAPLVFSPTDPFPNFTPRENQGKNIFLTAVGGVACTACHISEAFVNPSVTPVGASTTTTSRNIGLDAVSTDDLGIAEATNNPADEGKFRVPSLRNVGVTAPYMHDGRLATLEDVVEHYNSGVQPHPNLSAALIDPNDGTPLRLNLTAQQKAAIVAFLNTLTDDALLSDEKFSDPFVTACSAADLATPYGQINIDDIDAFATAFLADNFAADCDASGVLNFDDIDCFVAAFLAGCP